MSSEFRTTEVLALTFPFTQPDPCVAPDVYERLRRDQPVSRIVLPTGDPAWLVTRHEDVRVILADERFSRQALTGPDAPKLAPVPPMPSLFYLDPPQHTRIRRLAGYALDANRIARMRRRIQQRTEEHLDAMAAMLRPVDLLTAVARPLPLAVVAAILGVPSADFDNFARWTRTVMSFGMAPQEELMAAFNQLNGYLVGLIAARRQDVSDDVLGDLVTAADGGDGLSDQEILALVFDLLGAGDQPVTAEIVHAVLNLLRDPGRLRLLHDDPDLVPTAVEELLRHSQSAGGGLGSVRIALADAEIGGVTIRAGDPVIPSLNAANLDETVFTASKQVDLSRSPNPHLAFADGIHHCIGAAVGRMELRALIGGLAHKFPSLRLAVAESDLAWLPVPAFRTPGQIPVEW